MPLTPYTICQEVFIPAGEVAGCGEWREGRAEEDGHGERPKAEIAERSERKERTFLP